MPVEFWSGQARSDFTHENVARLNLIQSFREWFEYESSLMIVVFAFYCGNDVDVAVFKSDGIIVIELKDCASPIRATENGGWRILSASGGELAGGRYANPFQQVKAYRHALIQFLSARKRLFLSDQKASLIRFEHVSAMVCVSPGLHPDSRIEIEPGQFRWFHLTGLDRLAEVVGSISTKELHFKDQELRTLVRDVLNCNQLMSLPAFPSPQVIDFTFEPATVSQGDRGTLRWNVRYAHEVYIDNSIGRVPSSGSRALPVHEAAKYILTANGLGGSCSRETSVSLSSRSASPSPEDISRQLPTNDQVRSVRPRLKILPATSAEPVLSVLVPDGVLGEPEEIDAPELRAVFEISTYDNLTGTREPGRVKIQAPFFGEVCFWDIIDPDTGHFLEHRCWSYELDVSAENASRVEIGVSLFAPLWKKPKPDIVWVEVIQRPDGPEFRDQDTGTRIRLDELSFQIQFTHVESGESAVVSMIYREGRGKGE